jgi:hypothetical protein
MRVSGTDTDVKVARSGDTHSEAGSRSREQIECGYMHKLDLPGSGMVK